MDQTFKAFVSMGIYDSKCEHVVEVYLNMRLFLYDFDIMRIDINIFQRFFMLDIRVMAEFPYNEVRLYTKGSGYIVILYDFCSILIRCT